MENKKLIKYSLIYFLILFIPTLIFSISLNKSMESYFNNGLLDTLEVKNNPDYTLSYYYKGVEMDTYPTYSEAMNEDKYGILLYADNGLVYNRKTPLGTQSYIIDYSWLNSNTYNKDNIIHYVTYNKNMMILRTIYLSSGWVYMLFVFIIFLIIFKILSPTLLFFLVNIFTYFKYKSIPFKDISKEQFKYFELFRSLILTQVTNRLKSSKYFIYFSMIISYLFIMMLYNNESIAYINDLLFPIIFIYSGLLLVYNIYLIVRVLTDKETKTLTKELKNKLDIKNWDGV